MLDSASGGGKQQTRMVVPRKCCIASACAVTMEPRGRLEHHHVGPPVACTVAFKVIVGKIRCTMLGGFLKRNLLGPKRAQSAPDWSDAPGGIVDPSHQAACEFDCTPAYRCNFLIGARNSMIDSIKKGLHKAVKTVNSTVSLVRLSVSFLPSYRNLDFVIQGTLNYVRPRLLLRTTPCSFAEPVTCIMDDHARVETVPSSGMTVRTKHGVVRDRKALKERHNMNAPGPSDSIRVIGREAARLLRWLDLREYSGIKFLG